MAGRDLSGRLCWRQLKHPPGSAAGTIRALQGAHEPTAPGTFDMNWNDHHLHVKANWTLFKVDARRLWPELTDADLEDIGGEREKLTARLQERCGFTPKRANQEVDSWLSNTSVR